MSQSQQDDGETQQDTGGEWPPKGCGEAIGEQRPRRVYLQQKQACREWQPESDELHTAVSGDSGGGGGRRRGQELLTRDGRDCLERSWATVACAAVAHIVIRVYP